MSGRFIHVLWGEQDFRKRRTGVSTHQKTMIDLENLAKSKIEEAVVYCFGNTNKQVAADLGFETCLVDDNPTPRHSDDFWRIKVDGWLHALREGGGPIIHVDLDVRQVKELREDFWERMAEKDTLQAVLEQNRGIKIHFRSHDRRKVHSGKFVYLGDIETAMEVESQFEHKNRTRGQWDETAITATVMDRIGGWKDNEGDSLRQSIIHHDPFCVRARRTGCWRNWPEYLDGREQFFKFPTGNT